MVEDPRRGLALANPFWLILSRHYTTNVSPECCLDGHPARLRPFLSGSYDPEPRRYSPKILRGRLHIYLLVGGFFGSAASSFRPVTAIPGIPAGDTNPRLSEHQAGPTLVWEELRVRSRSEIHGLGRVHSCGVAWHLS